MAKKITRRKLLKDVVIGSVALGTGLGGYRVTYGQTKKPAGDIVFGEIMDLSGPTAALGLDTHNALLDTVTDANEKGGIDGHKIKLISIDCSYDTAKEIAAFRRFIDAEKMHTIFAYHSAPAFQLRDQLYSKRIVTWVSPDIRNYISPCATFGCVSPYPDLFKTVMKWMSDNWKESRKLKFGYICFDAPHTRANVPPLKSLAPRLPNVEYVKEWFTVPAPIDLSSEVLAMNAANIDWVIIHHTDTGIVTFVKDAKRLGFKGKIMVLISIANPALIDTCGPASEDVYVVLPAPIWDETNIQGIKVCHDWIQKYHPEFVARGPSPWYQTYITRCWIAVEATKLALRKVGYEKLTSKDIFDVLESGTEFNTMGILPPFKFSKEYHGPRPGSARIAQIKNKRVIPVAGPIVAPEWTPQEYNLDFYKY